MSSRMAAGARPRGRGSPGISVVVPTHERPEGLAAVLDALAAQTLLRSGFEVVIVDDGSAPATWCRLEELVAGSPLEVTLLRTPTNGGPARARNLGWRTAASDIVAFVDDDCVPAPGWLEAGLAALERHPSAGVVQGRTTIPAGTSIHGQRDWYVWRVIDGPSASFEACNIFYRRAALLEAGGFDEAIGWWGEDTSLGWSVIEAGWERAFAPRAAVVHAVERRGWRWHLRQGLLETNVVRLAAVHPGYRREAFWRAWAYRRADAAFVLAIVSVTVSRWWRPALVAVLPYLWWQRPSVRRPGFVRLCLQVPVVDAARCVGQLRGAVRFGVGMV